MRHLLAFLLLPVLAACHAGALPAGGFAAANVASIAVFGHAVPDMLVSAVSGRDCSVVRLDQGRSYCAPPEPPPDAPRYCTRSLGVVDCWAGPHVLADPPPGVADGPRALTPEQERWRTARWPKSLSVGF